MRVRSLGLALVVVVVALGVGTAAPRASTCDAQCDALLSLANLGGTVEELVSEQGLQNSLVAKVDAATSSVEDLRTTPALNQLGAFDNEVAADEQSGKTTTATSDVLKAKSDAAKNAIGNIR